MMDYNKPSKQLALDMINRAAKTGFRDKDIDLVDITYLDEGIYNTRVKLVPAKNSDYQESAVIEYDRIHIQQFFKGVYVTVKPAYQKRISDYLPVINAKYGLFLETTDIVDGVIPEENKPPFKVGIKIKPDNPAFYGEFEILISDDQKSIRNMVDGITFNGIPYPVSNDGDIQGPLYHYGEDWTELADYFINLNTGNPVDDNFKTQINFYTIDSWVFTPHATQYNYYNAIVLYNGEIDDDNEYTKKKEFTHVLVIQLDEYYCKGVKGHLIFHYNVKQDYTF